MVIIVSKMFNKEMGEYIKARNSRRHRGFFTLGFSKQPGSKGMPPIPSRKVEVIYPKAGWLSRLLPKKKTPVDDRQEIAEKVIEMIEEQKMHKHAKPPRADNSPPEVVVEMKEGFLSRIFKRKAAVEEDYGGPIEEPTLDPETIEVLKITGKWIMKLDHESKKEFRDSADYVKYKAFLDKYGLTKKKQ